MRTAALYLHALRAARPRQLLARAARPVRRRRFPRAAGDTLQSVAGAASLWRSPAFEHAALDQRGAGTRLYGFHQQYGEDVLEAARAGEAERAGQLMESWIHTNPPRLGDPWHPYVTSTRAGNWIAALTLEPALATAAVAESLRRQLAHVAANVEDDILGNHVIRNARALVLGGLALGADRLTQRGLRLLRRELPEQVLPDGGHYERSPVYHLLVLRDLLEIRAALDASFLDEPIERMRRFAAALARPDGHPALFNDGTLDVAPGLDLPAQGDGMAVFPETGYVVVRQEGLWLAFDCGPPAPPFLPAHAHADALSFQLWIAGHPVVIDPGTLTYENGSDRDAYRSTRAHSTVTVHERDQFELWGAFRSGPLPRVTLLSTEPLEAEVATASYRHRRRLQLEDGQLMVRDRIVALQPGLIDVRLVLAETATALPHSDDGSFVEEPAQVSECLYSPRPARAFVLRRDMPKDATLSWRIPTCGS